MRTTHALIFAGFVVASQAETRRMVEQLLLMEQERQRQIDMEAYKRDFVAGQHNTWSRSPDWRVPHQVQLNATPDVNLREAFLPPEQVQPKIQGTPYQFRQPEDPDLKLILPKRNK